MAGPAEFVHGKMFIGLMLNMLLFGINVTQTYFYYIHSQKDRLWVKIWVVIIFVTDLIQSLFGCLYLYQALIVHFGDVPGLSKANAVFAVVPTMTGLTAAIVQLFFARRILILTKNWYYVVFVIAAAASRGVCTIMVAYEGTLSPQFASFRVFKAVAIVGFVSEMLGDIIITSVLVWYLLSHKHKSSLRSTDKMVDPIIRVTIQTGLLTLIFAGLEMLFYLINPGGTYLLFNFILSKLYTCSLLSSLNSRQGWGYDVPESTEDQFHAGTGFGLRFSSTSNTDRTSMLEDPPLEDSSLELGLQKRHEVKNNCGVELST